MMTQALWGSEINGQAARGARGINLEYDAQN
jgi:hypothetical protein